MKFWKREALMWLSNLRTWKEYGSLVAATGRACLLCRPQLSGAESSASTRLAALGKSCSAPNTGVRLQHRRQAN